jgi:RND family efflux transporter MFP subunit
MKTLVYTSFLASAVAMAGCGTADHMVSQLPPVQVQVDKATTENQQQTVTVSGRIEATNSANLSTRMMGHVTALRVKTGDKVRKGQLLVSISSTDLQAKRAQVDASIAQAISALINAEKDYQRFQELFAKGSASQKELDNMTTRYEMAKSGVDAAQQMKREVEAQFAYTSISAPYDGTVINTFVKEGDMANPGMPLVAVEGAGAPEAVLLVPEAYITHIAVGQAAQITVKSSGKIISGKVTEVSYSAKNTGGQYIVKVALAATQDVLPGMFVNATIGVRQTDTVVSSPLVYASALIENGQLRGIYTIGTDNTAVLRWVRLGKQVGDKVEVLSGLAAGERYITQAQGKLFNGAGVQF